MIVGDKISGLEYYKYVICGILKSIIYMIYGLFCE